MALKYNEKTGEFEQEKSYAPSNSSSQNNTQKPRVGCMGSILLSLMYGVGAWTVGFFVMVIFFPNASDDAVTGLIVINFIISAVVAYITFNKISDR